MKKIFFSLAVSCLSLIAYSNAASVNEAVTRAYNQGLTQYTNVTSFQQYNALRRDEAAKFYVQFAQSVGKMDYVVPATSCNHFTDLNKAAADLRPYIIQACRMGIFKGGNGRFYPSDKLTNEQAIAVLMRIIDGPQPESWTNRSANYYQRAEELNVLSDVNMNDKKDSASRGNTVKVIYNAKDTEERSNDAAAPSKTSIISSKPTTPSTDASNNGGYSLSSNTLKTPACKDSLVMLACALGTQDCPSQCVTEICQAVSVKKVCSSNSEKCPTICKSWTSSQSTNPTYSRTTWSRGSCSEAGQSRTVQCQRQDGIKVADSYCNSAKPTTIQSCNPITDNYCSYPTVKLACALGTEDCPDSCGISKGYTLSYTPWIFTTNGGKIMATISFDNPQTRVTTEWWTRNSSNSFTKTYSRTTNETVIFEEGKKVGSILIHVYINPTQSDYVEICKNPLVMLACALGTQDCPNQCSNPTYSRTTWNRGSCSATCGEGTQTRSVQCQKSDGTKVVDSYCSGTKPTTSQSCNTQSCSNYGRELESAYAYAYGLWLTTDYPIDNANIYGNISERELTQVMTTWTKKVMNRTINTSEFTSSQPATRAVFVTLLSRALWGDANDGYDSLAHLNALKKAGMLTTVNDNDITTKEIRGYVYIILQKTDNDYIIKDEEQKQAQCKNPLVMLACSLGTQDCPTECRY